MRYTGIQPQYFPRLHYFARILNSDIFVIREDAQFVRKHKYPNGHVGKSYQAHSPIKQSFGTCLLSVPTVHERFLPIKETLLAYQNDWVQDHLKTLQISYSRAPFFSKLYPEIENLLSFRYKNLADLNIITTLWGILHILGESFIIKDKLNIEYTVEKLKKQNIFRLKDIKRAGLLNIVNRINLTNNEKIIALCKEVKADEDYCGGTGFKAYVDHKIFKKNGIKINVQDWKCGPYQQQFLKQQTFIPNLSIIDLLMHAKLEEIIKIMTG